MEGGRGAQFRTNHTRTAMMNFLNHVLAAVLGGFAMVCVHGDICTSSTNVFTVVVDLHASELGECCDSSFLLNSDCFHGALAR